MRLQIVACILCLIAFVSAIFDDLWVDHLHALVELQLTSGSETVSSFVEIVLLVVAIVLVIPVLAIGRYAARLFLYGRHLKIPLVLDPSALKKPFVLYLRSFESQSVTGKRDNKTMFSIGFAGELMCTFLEIFHFTEEQKLAKALRVIAPGVAVGGPDEEVPPLGFRRLYVGKGNWESIVRELMVKAHLVVLRLAGTDGVVWELNTAKELLPPERLLLLVPSESRLVLKRSHLLALNLGDHEKHDTRSGMKLPPVEHSLRNLEKVSIAGFIYFGADWKAHPVALETDPLTFQSDLVTLLAPVLKQLGVSRSLMFRLRYSLYFKLGLAVCVFLLIFNFGRC